MGDEPRTWILRVTNLVPFQNRHKYEHDSQQAVNDFNALPGREHIASYRVVFGEKFEYMHLFSFDHISRWEDDADWHGLCPS